MLEANWLNAWLNKDTKHSWRVASNQWRLNNAPHLKIHKGWHVMWCHQPSPNSVSPDVFLNTQILKVPLFTTALILTFLLWTSLYFSLVSETDRNCSTPRMYSYFFHMSHCCYESMSLQEPGRFNIFFYMLTSISCSHTLSLRCPPLPSPLVFSPSFDYPLHPLSPSPASSSVTCLVSHLSVFSTPPFIQSVISFPPFSTTFPCTQHAVDPGSHHVV